MRFSSTLRRFRRRCGATVLLALALSCIGKPAAAGTLDTSRLTDDLRRLSAPFDGRMGICARLREQSACIRGDERFPMQSVMKLVVAVATLDAVDRSRWRLDDAVVVWPNDLSVGVQPLARLVTPAGFRTTVRDLLSGAVVASDSAATDILIARLGGTNEVQALLNRHGLHDVRIDRDERHLQSETVGLTWRADYVDAARFRDAVKAVPADRRLAAFTEYLSDPRDTATPAAMVALLAELAEGHLLSPESTHHLMAVMSLTTTFPDRLKAGLPEGWSIGHKTGTGLDWQGINSATNDVGLLTAPDGDTIAVAAFLSRSKRSARDQAALIAATARIITDAYRSSP